MSGDFVGRARELRLFDEVLDAAGGGEGRLVVAAGEAGIGKTRLCREVARRAEKAGVLVAWGTCWPDAGAPPLWPWQAILAELGEAEPGEAAASSLLADDSGGLVVDPERFSRFVSVADQVARACMRAPALVVIDDAHAADPGAILLARFIARHLARLPLVLLLTRRLTRRPDKADGADGTDGADEAGSLRDLEDEATVMTLHRFGLNETTAFLRSYGYVDVDPDLQRTGTRCSCSGSSLSARPIGRPGRYRATM